MHNFMCIEHISVLLTVWPCRILSMTVPLYNVRFPAAYYLNCSDTLVQTEIAPPKIRGFIVGLAQQMIGIGFIVANWVGYGCQFLDGNQSWRISLGLQLVPAFLLLIGIQFFPYSPVSFTFAMCNDRFLKFFP